MYQWALCYVPQTDFRRKCRHSSYVSQSLTAGVIGRSWGRDGVAWRVFFGHAFSAANCFFSRTQCHWRYPERIAESGSTSFILNIMLFVTPNLPDHTLGSLEGSLPRIYLIIVTLMGISTHTTAFLSRLSPSCGSNHNTGNIGS